MKPFKGKIHILLVDRDGHLQKEVGGLWVTDDGKYVYLVGNDGQRQKRFAFSECMGTLVQGQLPSVCLRNGPDSFTEILEIDEGVEVIEGPDMCGEDFDVALIYGPPGKTVTFRSDGFPGYDVVVTLAAGKKSHSAKMVVPDHLLAEFASVSGFVVEGGKVTPLKNDLQVIDYGDDGIIVRQGGDPDSDLMFDLDPLVFSDLKSNVYCAVFLSYVDGSPSEQQGAYGAHTEILFCSKESTERKTVLILFQDEDEIRFFEYESEWKTVVRCKLVNKTWEIEVKLGDN